MKNIIKKGIIFYGISIALACIYMCLRILYFLMIGYDYYVAISDVYVLFEFILLISAIPIILYIAYEVILY